MQHPAHHAIPAWYRISNKDLGKKFSLSMHRKAFEWICGIQWTITPLLEHICSKYGLTGFKEPQEGSEWGFPNTFTPTTSQDISWITWDIHLVRLRPRPENEPIGDVMNIRASLHVVFKMLHLFEGDTGWHTNQLLTIHNLCLPNTENRFGSGSLSAILTPEAVKWLAAQTQDTELKSVTEEMRMTYEHIWPDPHNATDNRFYAFCEKPKWLSLSIPDDACCLTPETYHSKSLDKGYELVPHNVDSYLEQMTLLIGLAKLHDLMLADQTH